jgi:methionine-rich copper-binding protein CopC
MSTRFVLCLAVALAIAAVGGTLPAHAHAVLIEATPTPGTTVAGPDLSIRLRFNARLDHVRSSITLIAADGHAVKAIMAEDVPPEVLAARASGLAPGDYRLRWQVLAVDGHITRGDVAFTVRKP